MVKPNVLVLTREVLPADVEITVEGLGTVRVALVELPAGRLFYSADLVTEDSAPSARCCGAPRGGLRLRDG